MSDNRRLVQAKIDFELFDDFKETRHAAGKSITRLFEDFMRLEVLKESEARLTYLEEDKLKQLTVEGRNASADELTAVYYEMHELREKIDQVRGYFGRIAV